MDLDFQVSSVDVLDQIEFKFKNNIESIDSEMDQLKRFIQHQEQSKNNLLAENDSLRTENEFQKNEIVELKKIITQFDEKLEFVVSEEVQKSQQLMLSYEEEIEHHKMQLDLELDALATLYEIKIKHLTEEFENKINELKSEV